MPSCELSSTSTTCVREGSETLWKMRSTKGRMLGRSRNDGMMMLLSTWGTASRGVSGGLGGVKVLLELLERYSRSSKGKREDSKALRSCGDSWRIVVVAQTLKVRHHSFARWTLSFVYIASHSK